MGATVGGTPPSQGTEVNAPDRNDGSQDGPPSAHDSAVWAIKQAFRTMQAQRASELDRLRRAVEDVMRAAAPASPGGRNAPWEDAVKQAVEETARKMQDHDDSAQNDAERVIVDTVRRMQGWCNSGHESIRCALESAIRTTAAAQRFALDMNAAALRYQAMALADTRQSANEYLITQAAALLKGDNKADQDQLGRMLDELSDETRRIQAAMAGKGTEPPD